MKNLNQWLGINLMWLAGASFLLAEKPLQEPVGLLPQEAQQLVVKLLHHSDKELEHKKVVKIVPAKNYVTHPYWETVFKLGRVITPELRKQLEEKSSLTLEESLAFNASQCVLNREHLDQIISLYRVSFYSQPRKNGMIKRKIRPEYVTAEKRPYWEMLLLSPRIENLGVRRCVEALNRCGNQQTLVVLRRARVRFIMGEVATKTWHNDIDVMRNRASSTISKWLGLITKIDLGGDAGLRELLFALESVEKDYSQIASLIRFKDDPNYYPSDMGVRDHLLDKEFLKKTNDGDWVWKKAFVEIDLKNLTEREREVVKLMRLKFEEN